MPRQTNPTRRLERGRSAGWLSILSLALVALLMPASAAAVDAPGNNGTVKVHDGAGEPAAEVRNEPHVCSFHLHFFFADPVQSGTWRIEEWAPGDKGTLALGGTYDTAGDGEDRQPASGSYSLPDGHYKLFWDGDVDKHDKQKVFWVECAAPTPTPTPTPTPAGGVLGETAAPPPTGGVLAETGAPGTTLPPTDALYGDVSAPASDAWRFVLLVLAGILASLLALTPVKRLAIGGPRDDVS